MKVYVVAVSDMSCYSIKGIFTKKKDAVAFKRARSHRRSTWPLTIDTFELDPPNKPVRWMYWARVNKRGRVHRFFGANAECLEEGEGVSWRAYAKRSEFGAESMSKKSMEDAIEKARAALKK